MRAVRLVALALALISSTAADTARAHAGPAAVKAVVAMEGGEPTILLLNEGLALRRGEEWHYVCPALWGDPQMRDADSVQGGPVFIGGDNGLWLFQADGSAAAHPAPSAASGFSLRTSSPRSQRSCATKP